MSICTWCLVEVGRFAGGSELETADVLEYVIKRRYRRFSISVMDSESVHVLWLYWAQLKDKGSSHRCIP